MSYRLETTSSGQDLVIEGWENAISNNPYEGLADMRNVDNATIPGEVSVAMSTQVVNTQESKQNIVFTVDHTTDYFTIDPSVILEVNTAIIFTNSGGALPAGLSANTAYYIKQVSGDHTQFTISETPKGTQKLVTDNGSGTNTFSTIDIYKPRQIVKAFLLGYVWLYFMVDTKGRIWMYDSYDNTGTKSYKWVYTKNRAAIYGEASIWDSNLNNGSIIFWKNYLFIYVGSSSYAVWLIGGTVGGIPTIQAIKSVTELAGLENWRGTPITSTTSNIGTPHEMFVGQDDILYYTNGRSVGSLSEISDSVFSFAETHTNATGITTDNSTALETSTAFFQNTDIGSVIVGTGIPDNAIIVDVIDSKHATLDINSQMTITDTGVTFTITKSYTSDTSALDLPAYEISTCINELGENLLIGGINNYVYPWDRVSPSFEIPIFLPEMVTSKIISVNSTAYLFTGFSGRIFATNGSNVTEYYQVPLNLSKTVNPYIFWKDALFTRNAIYFGITATNNAGTTINEYGGLWTIDLNTGKGRLSNIMSHGTYSGYVGAICLNRGISVFNPPSADGYGLWVGWYDGTLSNIDKTISTPYIGGQAYITGDIIPVGQFLNKKTFSNIEFKLSTPLVSGESVAINYRTSVNGTWTPLTVLQGGGVGEVSGIAVPDFQDVEWIQLQVVLTSTATTPSYCRLRQVRIR